MTPELKDIDAVIGEYDGLARKALDYTRMMKAMVDAAKEPGFSIESWGPLSEMVAIEDFVRVGNFKEVMTWPDYIGFLTEWAKTSDWEGSFKRVTESGNLVFLELEERSRVGAFTSVVNSVSVYAFDDAGKIAHLDIYLQMPMPSAEMLKSYEGIEISG